MNSMRKRPESPTQMNATHAEIGPCRLPIVLLFSYATGTRSFLAPMAIHCG